MHDNTKMLPLEFWSVAMGNSICTNSKAMVSKKIQELFGLLGLRIWKWFFDFLIFFTDSFKFLFFFLFF